MYLEKLKKVKFNIKSSLKFYASMWFYPNLYISV